MSNITPNTSLEFFKNTGLSPNYENALYFSSSGERDNYFSALYSITVPNCTYQRENLGFCRVQLPVAQLYQCDYMRFKNWNFENKWYYAFIINVNYINNETTEVQYVIDYLMTWMGDFGFNQCYIERQHVKNDSIGANICEEGLPVGNYCTELQTSVWTFAPENAIARIAVANGRGTNDMGHIYSGSSIEDCDSQEELNRYVRAHIDDNTSDSIVSIILIPNNISGPRPVTITNNSIPKPYDNIMGYKPRNNKLFCYPYKYCIIDNREGSTIDLMYEYMGTTPDATSSGNMSFTILAQGYPSSCEVALFPNNYKGSTGSEYRITMTHFPVCSFSVNSYEAYLAQKNAYYKQDMALTIANAGLNAYASTMHGAIGGYSGGIQSGLSNQAKQASTGLQKGVTQTSLGQYSSTMGAIGAMQGFSNAMVDASTSILGEVTNNMIINAVRPESPSTQKGSESSDLWYSTGGKSFNLYEKCITKNYAMMLDSYFDMFGYAIKQHGTPNMNARENWTYIKTIGCNIKGAIPAYDAKIIEKLFDKGIRFWKSLENIGNYSLSNNPI